MLVENEIIKLEKISKTIDVIEDCLDTEKLKKEMKALKENQMKPDFWENEQEAKKTNIRLSRIEDRLHDFIAIEKQYYYLKELVDVLEASEKEQQMYEDLITELKELEEHVEKTYLTTLLKGKYDDKNAMVSLHFGAGGVESRDWVEMLFRMYSRYAEDKGYDLKILNSLKDEEAGYKSISFLVSGENAYGYLKCEKGVHRLVRISPFDANGRRHTSFASVEVVPELDELEDIELNDDDLKIDTYRSGGAGGQHVNKTDSAVRITHIPTGIVVQCQDERSQIKNKEIARKMLISKLAELQEREELEKLSEIKGELKKIEWGSQIRSYTFHPYNLVKDHRTNFENSDAEGIMDGNIQGFIDEYLKKSV